MKTLLLTGLFFCSLSCGNSSQKKNIKTSQVTLDTVARYAAQITPIADTISLIAVGDIMFGSNFPDASTLPPNDGKDLLKNFKEELQNADLTFGNAEGVFLDGGGKAKDSGRNVYAFRQPSRYAQHFSDNGFDLLSVANNHVADFGETGIQSTVATLKALPLNFAGLQKYPTTIITVRSIKIGMAAFAPNKGCVQMNNYKAATASIRKLKEECDIVMVSFHGGAEGKNATHVPKRTEIYYKQNRGNVYEFAHKMIDAGADIIIGHGPHVPRAMELYKNKIIAYSLGNFCTYGMFNLKGVNGIAPLLKIYVNENGDFIKGKITSIKQEGEGGPLYDENHEAYYLIKKLTTADIPNKRLRFIDERKEIVAR